VLVLEQAGEALVARIEAAAREALARDRCGAIVLGCAGMAPLCASLSTRLGVPVIDGVSVAVKLAESLVALGLRTSKHGDYAPPPPKAWTGWSTSLAG
jgi:allantoin racemase